MYSLYPSQGLVESDSRDTLNRDAIFRLVMYNYNNYVWSAWIHHSSLWKVDSENPMAELVPLVASYLDPTQFSVACSMEKQE